MVTKNKANYNLSTYLSKRPYRFKTDEQPPRTARHKARRSRARESDGSGRAAERAKREGGAGADSATRGRETPEAARPNPQKKA